MLRRPLLLVSATVAMLAVSIIAAAASHAPSSAEPETPVLFASSMMPLPGGGNVPSTSALAKTGCGLALPIGVQPGISVRRHVTTSEGDREYLLHVPAGAPNDRPLPLVLNFHGRGSDAATQERYSGLVPVADRAGFILVSPDGVGRAWSAGATRSGVDDIAFVNDLIDQLRSELCVDSSRVYATGFSNGAFMAARLGCALGDRIAAFAAVAGNYYPSTETCLRAVPVLALHGTSDSSVPFARGMVRGDYLYQGARAETANWAQHDGCGDSPLLERLSAHVSRETYSGCKAPVVLYVIDGGAHTWPGATDADRPGTPELNAAEAIWTFFAGQRLPAK